MSINGNKFNTPQWDRNDGIGDCSVPEKAPTTKRQSRDTVFCKDVTIEGNLVVEGNVIINGTLTVAGTITAPFFNGTAAKAITASSIG